MSEDTVRKGQELFGKGQLEWRCERTQNAVDLFEEFIELGKADPDVARLDDFSMAFFNIAEIHADRGEWASSIPYYENALSVGVERILGDERKACLWRRLGLAYHRLSGRPEEGSAALRKAIEYDEKDERSRQLLVSSLLDCYAERKRVGFREAVSLLHEAHAHNEILKATAPHLALDSFHFNY